MRLGKEFCTYRSIVWASNPTDSASPQLTLRPNRPTDLADPIAAQSAERVLAESMAMLSSKKLMLAATAAVLA